MSWKEDYVDNQQLPRSTERGPFRNTLKKNEMEAGIEEGAARRQSRCRRQRHFRRIALDALWKVDGPLAAGSVDPKDDPGIGGWVLGRFDEDQEVRPQLGDREDGSVHP